MTLPENGSVGSISMTGADAEIRVRLPGERSCHVSGIRSSGKVVTQFLREHPVSRR